VVRLNFSDLNTRELSMRGVAAFRYFLQSTRQENLNIHHAGADLILLNSFSPFRGGWQADLFGQNCSGNLAFTGKQVENKRIFRDQYHKLVMNPCYALIKAQKEGPGNPCLRPCFLCLSERQLPRNSLAAGA